MDPFGEVPATFQGKDKYFQGYNLKASKTVSRQEKNNTIGRLSSNSNFGFLQVVTLNYGITKKQF